MTSRRVLLAVAAALALVAAAVVATLSQSAPRLTGSNSEVEHGGVAIGIPGHGGTRCQDNELVPKGTGRVRLFLSTFERRGGPLDITIATGGREGVPPRVVARGTLAAPFGGGSHLVDVAPRFSRDLEGARVCLANRGASAITFSGNRTPVLGSGANPFQLRLDDEVRVDYLYPHSRSWWSLAGPVAGRFGLAKTSFFGSWTMWAMFAVLALLWAGVVVLLLRVTRA
jgi:hypothetical protein